VSARIAMVDIAAKLWLAEPGRDVELLARTGAGEACLARLAATMA
jgi:hypothetical protein